MEPRAVLQFRVKVRQVAAEDAVDEALFIRFIELCEAVREDGIRAVSEEAACLAGLDVLCNVEHGLAGGDDVIGNEHAMLTLIEKGMTREQAYDLVQPKTAQSWDNQVDFKPLLEADPEVTSRLTQEEIDEIFNPTYYTKRVDEIFERIGLGD